MGINRNIKEAEDSLTIFNLTIIVSSLLGPMISYRSGL